MNILVTGANGQLGNEIRIVSKGSQDKYIFTDVMDASEESLTMLHKLAGDGVDTSTTKLDITDLESIRDIVRSQDVNVIINCAAYTNVDKAETDQALCELLNAKAPENLAIAMKEVGGLLVHISTDYVFGGDPYNTPCKEDQKGTPTGVYGLTKLHGEQNIQKTGVDDLIFRTAWLYSEFGKNFVKTMLNLTATKPQLRVVFDQTGTPTYAYDLAKAIIDTLWVIDRPARPQNSHSGLDPGPERSERWRPEGGKSPATRQSLLGIYHYSNEGVCSWYDFTMMIAEYAGHTACDIQPCHSGEYPSLVTRPAYSVLDKTKFKLLFKTKVPYWTESLNKCVNRLKLG